MTERRLLTDLPSRRRAVGSTETASPTPSGEQRSSFDVILPECQRCIALCCRWTDCFLYDNYEWDRRIIAEGKFYTDAEGRKHLARRADGSCVYLGADHRCQIYERRPAACRQYTCLRPMRALGLVLRAEHEGIAVTGLPPHEYLISIPALAHRWRVYQRLKARLAIERARKVLST